MRRVSGWKAISYLAVFALGAVAHDWLAGSAMWTYHAEEAAETSQAQEQEIVATALKSKQLSVQVARSKAGLPPVQRSAQAQAKIAQANIKRAQHDIDAKD
jgi:hypothetical protein